MIKPYFRFFYAIFLTGVFVWFLIAALSPAILGMKEKAETGLVIFCGVVAVVAWLKVLGIIGKK